ncbi:MAG: sirohydrochlorin chelatase [Pseudomonadota bacterium]
MDGASHPENFDGLLLCGHGSRSNAAASEFAACAEKIAARRPDTPFAYGYLEFAAPNIRDALDGLRARGVRRVAATPGMLFAAGHAKNDIPSVLNAYQSAHPEMTISYGRELGVDLRMLAAARDRIEQAIADAQTDIPIEETALVVIGRGASDPDANANVAKVARMLWEGMGFGWGMYAYSGVTFPLVAPGLDQAAKLGWRRLVVFPYFLFSGILIDRIYNAVDEAAARHPQIEFLKAGYLNDHDAVIDTFLSRFDEIGTADANMNCQLCKYRAQFIGFEDEVGLRQESHHHHVEAASGGAEHAHHHHDHNHHHDHGHGHGHGHGHDHDHGHHHHPYPHADHPLGPRTLASTD